MTGDAREEVTRLLAENRRLRELLGSRCSGSTSRPPIISMSFALSATDKTSSRFSRMPAEGPFRSSPILRPMQGA